MKKKKQTRISSGKTFVSIKNLSYITHIFVTYNLSSHNVSILFVYLFVISLSLTFSIAIDEIITDIGTNFQF